MKQFHQLDYLMNLIERGGPVASEYDELINVFTSINLLRKNERLNDESILLAREKLSDVFGTLDTMSGHACLQPYGYAGDFEMIEKIYQVRLSSNPKLVNWDIFFHAQEAPMAVRNRKQYILDVLAQLKQRTPSARILNVANGPAREIYEFLSRESSKFFFDCIDFDKSAVEYAANLNKDFTDQMQFHRKNAFRFSTDNCYDLVWSAGLFDYLDERAFKILLKKLLRLVKTGGELIVGNFSLNNPTRDYMEFGDWVLIHRSKDELRKLAEEIGVRPQDITINSEPLGVNLFLHIKQTSAKSCLTPR